MEKERRLGNVPTMEEILEMLKYEDEAILPLIKEGRFYEYERKYLMWVLLDDNHPYTLSYFPSRLSSREEKRKQFHSKDKYMIHPLSKLSFYYDVYLIALHLSMFVLKGLSFGFFDEDTIAGVIPFLSAMNLLCWIDIFICFRRGYVIHKSKTVVLEKSRVAWKYVTSIYFISDVLSSFPKHEVCLLFPNFCSRPMVFCVVNTFAIFRLVRLITFTQLVKKICFHYKLSQNFVILFNYFVLFSAFVHWMACLHFAVPRYRYFIYGSYSPTSWVVTTNLINDTLVRKYVYCWFRSFGYSLSVDMPGMSNLKNFEEEIFILFHYLIGKTILAISWLILVHIFTLSHTLKSKYQEMIDQVDFYMSIKQFPLDLRKRMIRYYRYKYQGQYINEERIKAVLSDRLKQEVLSFSKKKFVKLSKIFDHMSPQTVDEVLSKLNKQIYLPKDIIIQSGTEGDGLYFLAEGTVAVYTRSGKEICHLQEGAYFGEISLMMSHQPRNATIVAVETCSVMKLDKRSFKKCFMENEGLCEVIYEAALRRMAETSEIEEEYQQWMFKHLLTPVEIAERLKSREALHQ